MKQKTHNRILWMTALTLLFALILTTGTAFAGTISDDEGNTMTITGTVAAGQPLHVEAVGMGQELYTEDPSQIDPGLPDGQTLYLPVQIRWVGTYDTRQIIDLSPGTTSADITIPHVGHAKIAAEFRQYTLQTLASDQGDPSETTRAWVASGTVDLKESLTMLGSVRYDAGAGQFKNGRSVKVKYYKDGAYVTKRPTPTAKKKYFMGWYTKSSGGKLITNKTKVSFGKKQIVTYYAHWGKRGTKSPVIHYKGKNATRIPVITYHRLATSAEKRRYGRQFSSLFVVNTTFNRQMKWLHDHNYYTVSTQEFYLWYKGKIKLPKKSVLITFDDGMYSIIKYGLPTLKKYKMKGTMFMIGNMIPKKTNKNPLPNGAYHTTGKDVMKQVTLTYPDFEFQSHTWGMHVRGAGGNGYARTKSYAYQKADFQKMYKKFGYEFLAYPFGHYTDRTIKAAKAGHIKMAFTYGADGYAYRSQNKYKIRRIKIDGNASMSRFTRWF